jgi:hypothetical protein
MDLKGLIKRLEELHDDLDDAKGACVLPRKHVNSTSQARPSLRSCAGTLLPFLAVCLLVLCLLVWYSVPSSSRVSDSYGILCDMSVRVGACR